MGKRTGIWKRICQRRVREWDEPREARLDSRPEFTGWQHIPRHWWLEQPQKLHKHPTTNCRCMVETGVAEPQDGLGPGSAAHGGPVLPAAAAGSPFPHKLLLLSELPAVCESVRCILRNEAPPELAGIWHAVLPIWSWSGVQRDPDTSSQRPRSREGIQKRTSG